MYRLYTDTDYPQHLHSSHQVGLSAAVRQGGSSQETDRVEASPPIIYQNNFNIKPGNIPVKIIIIRFFTANINSIYFAVQILLFFSKECSKDFARMST